MLKASFRDRTRGVDVRIGILFSKLRIPPNVWTVLSLAPALGGFMALYNGSLAWGLLLFFFSAFMDIIDGTVARVTDSVSNLGAFLDGVVDRYVEFTLYLGLYFYLRSTPEVLLSHHLLFLFLLFGALMPSFITAYADHRHVIADPEKLRNIGGLMERFERLGVIYAGMLFGLADPVYLTYAVILVAVLSHLTALQRIFYVIREG
ncbi:MAG: CDP-alcohol phosphatidyltransferase family protein [Candidatus Altiarchaeales archaeon]|nr:CDP-alcohol phosphatidyltransferase family protein [Candidatus Altiarchaeales archaeon]MBD3416949.1 CDP-alcohol phosphatidyltransferase family protein [Candidatus Altiarchaeales archaeon]